MHRVRLLVGLLLLAAAAPVQAQPQVQQQAQAALQARRYDDAIRLVTPLIRQNPRNVQALLLRAQAYEGAGNAAAAASDYQAALRVQPNNAVATAGLSRARQRLSGGQTGPSAQPTPPRGNDPGSRLRYAEQLMRARRWREAASEYRAYLNGNPPNPGIVQRYLVALSNAGDSAEGEQAAERYLRSYATNGDLWMRLGYFQLWQGKRAEAVRSFQQALRLEPGNREATQGLQQAQAAPPPGQGGQAGPSEYPIDRLARELRATPGDDEKRFELIDLLLANGRFFEARQNLNAISARARNTAEWQRRATVADRALARFQRPGQGRAAEFPIDRLYRELRANPNQDEKRFQLVAELIKYRRYGEAVDQLASLRTRHLSSQRFRTLFLQADEGLRRSGAQVYPIDRLSVRLSLNPDDVETRQQLADELIRAERFEEAYDVLTDGRFSARDTPENRARLARVEQARAQRRAARMAELQQRLSGGGADAAVFRELASLYLAENRPDDALSTYERLIQIDRSDSTRLGYGQTLQVAGRFDQARTVALELIGRGARGLGGDGERLLDEAKVLYVQATLAAGAPDAQTEQYLQDLIARDPDNAELLLNLATIRFQQGNLDEAESLNLRASGFGDVAVAPRIEILRRLIERERVRQRDAADIAVINEARVLARERRFEESLRKYEEYFALRGRRTRDEVKEYAGVYSAAGDFVTAVSIWRSLLVQRYEYDVEKEIAKNLYYLGDYAGTIATAERLVRDNPADFELRFLLADAYRETSRFAEAERLLREAERIGQGSELIEERQALVEAGSTVSAGFGGNNYAPVLAPIMEATYAEGGGTLYFRHAYGLFTQVTMPGRFVVSAGLTSHYQRGNRFLQVFPTQTDRVPYQRLNQVYAGIFRDFSRVVVPGGGFDYTSRLQARAGIIDTEGDRTVPFYEARLSAQNPAVWRGSVGFQSTEGSYTLWSAAGGEYDLRLTQFDARYETALPDSVFRFKGSVNLNVVTDDLPGGTNTGLGGLGEGSVRVLPWTYLGIGATTLNYRRTTDLYFSPTSYTTLDGFLEYEKGLPSWDSYIRLRASVGSPLGSGGFISRRVDGDLIRRFNRHLSIVLSGGVGQSTRPLSQNVNNDPYTIITFQGALYLTL
ncbi:MAG TPA: tetratricopeptide repeat protein [Rhodothermales bacterium]|nr:tetratricopeptide repeat protein [Rhodothermales bacterium]